MNINLKPLILCLAVLVCAGCGRRCSESTSINLNPDKIDRHDKMDPSLRDPRRLAVKELQIGQKVWCMKHSVWVEEDGSCWVNPAAMHWSLETDKDYEKLTDYVFITRTGEDEVSIEVYGKNKFIISPFTPYKWWKVREIVVK